MTTSEYQKQQAIAKSNENWVKSDKNGKNKQKRINRTYCYQGIPKAQLDDLASILGERVKGK